MVKTMKTAVFYADILGFSIAATEPGAGRALGQLSDVAHILSTENSLAKYLQRQVWNARYGLSDSIFLLARDAADTCLAGAEFFFNLASYNATEELPVLMRGSITFGEVRKTRPIFPETAKGNVVGEAVVRAVQLERSGPKGPRLLVSAEVAKALKKNSSKKHLLDIHAETNELLWLLPEDLALAEGLLIGDVAGAACRLALSAGPTSAALPHLAAYADLAIRSILRLKQFNPDAARIAIRKSSIDVLRNRLTRLYDRIGEDSAGRRGSLFRLLK
jgi:hypothetical protein